MDVKQDFADRVDEINAYLDLLDTLTREAQSGSPKLGGATITTQQQRILYSSVYLQLYNLTEATITWCLKAITQATSSGNGMLPADLSEDMLREWVKTTARTAVPLNSDKRLQVMVSFCKLILDGAPLSEWEVATGGGGNWDDYAIERVSTRLGIPLSISPHIKAAVKRRVRDDFGALQLVKEFRNKLAHGELSFTECGNGVSATDLRALRDDVVLYLEEVINHFIDFVSNRGFLKPSPAGGAL